MRDGRGILVFDDGWHKLATALWLFGPIKEVRAWIGRTEIVPGFDIDAPTTIVWEHDSGIRGVWDITLAIDMYLRSDYYTNDERWEVTGRRGYARVNRCTGRGIQQPSLEIYADGEMRSYHALDDDWASSFRDSGRHWLHWLHTGDGPTVVERRRGHRRPALRPRRLQPAAQPAEAASTPPHSSSAPTRTTVARRERADGQSGPAARSGHFSAIVSNGSERHATLRGLLGILAGKGAASCL